MIYEFRICGFFILFQEDDRSFVGMIFYCETNIKIPKLQNMINKKKSCEK